MANKFTDSVRETAALAVTAMGGLISLHTADPGVTGASEVAGGAYARLTTTWAGGAVDGVVQGSQVEFDAPASATTVTHIGCRSAGGTFLWSSSITSTTLPASSKFRVTPSFSVPQGS